MSQPASTAGKAAAAAIPESLPDGSAVAAKPRQPAGVAVLRAIVAPPDAEAPNPQPPAPAVPPASATASIMPVAPSTQAVGIATAKVLPANAMAEARADLPAAEGPEDLVERLEAAIAEIGKIMMAKRVDRGR